MTKQKLVSLVFLFLLILDDSVLKRSIFVCLDFIDECLQLIICKVPLVAFATHGLFLLSDHAERGIPP